MTFHEAFPYVAGAYLSVWVLILAYVAIIGRKLSRLERMLDALEQAEPANDAAE